MSAIPIQVQALGAAFGLGILFQAGITGLQLYIKGYGFGKKLWKDSRRLVLALFFIAVGIWSQVAFVSIMTLPNATLACQITTSISTLFDQGARIAIGGFLLWSVAHISKSLKEKYVLRSLIGTRVIVGGLFVGFSRPQFDPICVPLSTVLPISVATISLDVIIIGVVTIRLFTLGLFKQSRDKTLGIKQEQSKGLVFASLGFLVWMLTSVPMTLGFRQTILLLMVAVPAGGLSLLVAILSAYYASLVLPRAPDANTPEARSPFIVQSPAHRPAALPEVQSNDGTPTVENSAFRKNLFVVNPSDTPKNSPFITNRRDSVKRDDYEYSDYTTSTVREVEEDMYPAPNAPKQDNKHTSSKMFGTILAAPLAVAHQAVEARFSTGRGPSTSKVGAVDDGQPKVIKAKPATSERKGLFGRKQGQKIGVRKLGISGPVISEDEGFTAFARMPTIDLNQAAKNERQRREDAGKRLVAIRSAPPPPDPSGYASKDALKRSISTKRKELGSADVAKSIPRQTMANNSAALSANVSGTSTSASLSPGRDDLRRRSPGSQVFEKFEETNEQRKLQRQNTLPSNPKGGLPAHPSFQQPRAASMMKQRQTVMLMKEIIYNDPIAVNSISRDAKMYSEAKEANALASVSVATLKPTRSIIHRPRPYVRQKNGDRGIFPSEKSPASYHRRSKSGSSASAKGSYSNAESFTEGNLPPLPALPTTADDLKKLLPNDTKSMTVDEKIEFLFPAPPRSNREMRRRSSIHSVSRIETGFDFGVTSVSPGVQDSIWRSEGKFVQSNSRLLSRTLQVESGKLKTEDDTRDDYSTVNLRNPVDSELPASAMTNATFASVSQGGTSIWASLHSPINPVDIAKERNVTKATYVQMRKNKDTDSSTEPHRIPIEAAVQGFEAEAEDIDIMLDIRMPFHSDTQEASRFSVTTAPSNRGSLFLDKDLEEAPPIPKPVSTWHRRSGDVLPTFSESRKLSRRGARTMPPPAPLRLNTFQRALGAATHEILQSPEPKIVDSPNRAYLEIQAQLERLEKPEDDSAAVMNTLQNIKMLRPTDPTSTNKKDSRIGLLENLEKEMGDQQNVWSLMQHKLSRDSNGTLVTSQDLGSDLESQYSITPQSSPHMKMPLVVSPEFTIEDSKVFPAEPTRGVAPSLEGKHQMTSLWQQKLAGAQMKYLENTNSQHTRKRSVNFFNFKAPVVNATPENIASGAGSQTENIDIHFHLGDIAPDHSPKTLWKPQEQRRVTVDHMLWTSKTSDVSRGSVREAAAKDVRPTPRRLSRALSIESTNLWVKSTEAVAQLAPALWGFCSIDEKKPASRPKTLRPIRISRRGTLLPDILEMPSPLPHNRDALGIFQYPWGEKSDIAIYAPLPARSMSYIPEISYGGPSALPSFNARSHRLDPPNDTSSFFDDYEDENDSDADIEGLGEEDEDSSDMGENESDEDNSSDEFDDNTLFEIANLLGSRTEDIPSRKSMFSGNEELVDDYESVDFPTKKNEVIKFIPIMPLAKNVPIPPKELFPLWTQSGKAEAHQSSGLTQPTADVWQSYLPATEDLSRNIRSHSEIATTALESKAMWSRAPEALAAPAVGTLWEDSKTTSATQEPIIPSMPQPVSVQARESLLWTSPGRKTSILRDGMFTLDVERDSFRTTSASPAAIDTVRQARSMKANIAKLATDTLWEPVASTAETQDWMSQLASTFIKSPSQSKPLHTASSTVPTDHSISSDKLDITEVLSSSTELLEETSLLLENTSRHMSHPSPKKPTTPNKAQVTQRTSGPARESRVLANRNMWESMGPKSTNVTSANISWRSTLQRRKTIKVVPKIQRPKASAGDWKMALSQAIAAGYVEPTKRESLKVRENPLADLFANVPSMAVKSRVQYSPTPRLQRPDARKQDWEAAPAEALPLISATSHTRRFDSGDFSLDPFGQSILPTTLLVHPITTEDVLEAQVSTPAVQALSPKLLWSTNKNVVSNKSKISSLMWARSSNTKFTEADSDALSIHKDVPRTFAPVSRTDHRTLPIIKSSALFDRTMATTTSSTNWLQVTATAREVASTWTRPVSSALSPIELQSFMWTKSNSLATIESPSTFVPAQLPRPIQKPSARATLAVLPDLSSDALFVTSFTPEITKNWLQASTISVKEPEVIKEMPILTQSAEKKPPKSFTWTPSSPIQISSQADSQGLWSLPKRLLTQVQHASEASFIQYRAAVESESREAKSSTKASLPILSTKSLWSAPSPPILESKRHWLHTTALTTSVKAVSQITMTTSTAITQQSMTWTSPTASVEPIIATRPVGLWESRSARTVAMFNSLTAAPATIHIPAPRVQKKTSAGRPLALLRSDSFWTPEPEATTAKLKDWLRASTVRPTRLAVVIPEAVPDMVRDDESEVSIKSSEEEVLYLSPTTYAPQTLQSSFQGTVEVDEEEVDRLGEQLMGKEMWRYSKGVGAGSVKLLREEWKSGKGQA